jgi:hypothetical protein
VAATLQEERYRLDGLPEDASITIRHVTHLVDLHASVLASGITALAAASGAPTDVIVEAVKADRSLSARLNRVRRLVLQTELIDAGIGELSGPLREAFLNSEHSDVDEVVARVGALVRHQRCPKLS